ncbi:hypothetical protein PIIN_11200 [Serendipita indica DSM 11827]|uniref:Uncharacterized protein n=1 Tax=Serendipita indica (strain DSM 11827) TaxID=1109443 RepID=G4U0X5_SERID|nr:hypothetical protein PIIN_11200 [Serendipita indica DSM 11827]
MPIATVGSGDADAQGSVTFFFHENRDKNGNPSNKVFSVSNHHVLRTTDEKYELKGAGAPRQYVRVNGYRRFQRGLDEIKHAVTLHILSSERIARKITWLEESSNQGRAEGESSKLRNPQKELEEQKCIISELHKFYNTVMAQWSDVELRNIGHIHYCPPISINTVKGEEYTEDWGGNVVDLGTEISDGKLSDMLYSLQKGNWNFKYPHDRQMRIRGVVTKELLDRADMIDNKGRPCLIVLKDGCATDLTVGRYAGLESFAASQLMEIPVPSFSTVMAAWLVNSTLENQEPD